MTTKTNSYDYIASNINLLKEKYPSLRTKSDDYVFSVLCVKAHFYKNPALVLNEDDFLKIVVDGWADGGADILLSDPNSEGSDLVIGQSKFHKNISTEQVLNAVRKMADFYKDMTAGHYERFNSRVQSRFLTLNAEVGEESKIHFVFYTSAPKKKINTPYIEKKFREQFTALDKVELSILFADDIAEEIREAKSTKRIVERGDILIDKTNNCLRHDDDAAIVNVSARSITELYAKHDINLLARNLRYYIKGGKKEKTVDDAISKTIRNAPDAFWLKNNGITIICDDFRIDGRVVHLKNFSIVNGGQTTYQLHKNASLVAEHNFYLPCKIIKTKGHSEQEKLAFSLEIATAANSQKAITNADLKANAPEQITFAKAMLQVGVFYQSKRGEDIPKKYRPAHMNTKLDMVGKLCLAAIFQEPCKSRTNPSVAYKEEKYYTPIFRENQEQVARICKELLYIDSYFLKKFLPEFKRDDDNGERVSFACIARRICVAFVALAARYHQGNLTKKDLEVLTAEQPNAKDLYETFRDLGEMKYLLPMKIDTDAYDETLNKLFTIFIKSGGRTYKTARKYNSKITETNFFKSDRNYYDILDDNWETLEEAIQQIFADA